MAGYNKWIPVKCKYRGTERFPVHRRNIDDNVALSPTPKIFLQPDGVSIRMPSAFTPGRSSSWFPAIEWQVGRVDFRILGTTPPSALPSPWMNQNIGSVGLSGSASLNGTFTVNASGADIWGTSDSFHFLYQPLSGDGQSPRASPVCKTLIPMPRLAS
ncbi:MAG: hypothetical protein WKH64_14200 [Chloroflexia bacterium]